MSNIVLEDKLNEMLSDLHMNWHYYISRDDKHLEALKEYVTNVLDEYGIRSSNDSTHYLVFRRTNVF